MAWLSLVFLLAWILIVASPLIVAAVVIFVQSKRRKRPGRRGFDVTLPAPAAPEADR